MDRTFDAQTLAADLTQVHRIYTHFFEALDKNTWDEPVKGDRTAWTLHETVAHLCALNGDGLQSVKTILHGEPYTWRGLDNRYKFNAFNRRGIDHHLLIPMEDLFIDCLGILEEAACIARDLQPDQAALTGSMPIYNRPVTILEALSIITIHAGLFHAAQVAEPAGLPPLWVSLSPEIRHRLIGRVMRAFSLLYRPDIGGPLSATLAYRVDGPGGGEWYVNISPDASTSAEGTVQDPTLVVHLRDTAAFCEMATSRLSLPLALLRGDVKLSGNLGLFLRMPSLFSVDARPKVVPLEKHYPLLKEQEEEA